MAPVSLFILVSSGRWGKTYYVARTLTGSFLALSLLYLQILFGLRWLESLYLWAVDLIIQDTCPLRIPKRPSHTWAEAWGFISIWVSKRVF